MKKQRTFGNTSLAKKMATKFGTSQESVCVEMRYAKQVHTFLRKIEGAHKKAANSSLKFG